MILNTAWCITHPQLITAKVVFAARVAQHEEGEHDDQDVGTIRQLQMCVCQEP